MTYADLRARLRALGAGGLKGRHAYGVATALASTEIPAEIQTEKIDGQALLATHDWPRGEQERHQQVEGVFAGALVIARKDISGPLLLLVEHADSLIGEIETLASLYDYFLRDNRMAVFFCTRCGTPPALADAPQQLVYRPNAALIRLRDVFKLEVVEAD